MVEQEPIAPPRVGVGSYLWGGVSRRVRPLFGTGGLRVLAAAGGGFAVYGGMAPSSAWWATILGMGLFGLAVHGRRMRVAAGLSFLFGLCFYLPLLTWSNVYVGSVPWVALSGMEALLVIPAGWLIAAASRRLPWWPLWAASAWVLGEALRARFPFGGFPWGGIAFTQADGPLLPAVSLVGSAGLAFLVALAGFGLADLTRRVYCARQSRRAVSDGTSRGAAAGVSGPATVGAFSDAAPASPVRKRTDGFGPRALVGPLVAVALPFLIGVGGLAATSDGADAPHTVIGVVQGNVPEPGLEFNARRRAVLDMHALQSDTLAAAVKAGTAPAPSFVIWPENSSDIDPYANPDAAAVIDEAVRELGVPVLVGAVVGTDQPRRNYNMGIVWDPVTGPAAKGSDQTYSKRHPVPFGEYMPYREFFRIFSDKVDLLQSEFLPGSRPGNLQLAGVNVGDVICFEIVYDGIVRDVIDGGAQVLVVQTNNATFGYTNETWQQQAMSRIRAVEFGREVLVVSTSGVSAVIRPDGSVESRIGLFEPGYLTPSVPLMTVTTPAAVIGGILEWVLVALAPLGLILVGLRARFSKRGTERRSTARSAGDGPLPADR